ncbi:hypothetical protein ACJJTC_014871 [Scirpophaga incertulas]
MAKDIIVLTPNGRRQKVHCTPDTSMLQVLEEVCKKHDFQAVDYNLKHHNHILDLTTTIRFSNLPNKALLEMVESEKKRVETIVTVGLLLEDGDRRTADFPPSTSLYDLTCRLASKELKSLTHPTILYMRQEVVGEVAMKETTLRQLGLIGGRAILRLLNKAEDRKQANVSTVYRKAVSEKSVTDSDSCIHSSENQQIYAEPVAGPSNSVDVKHSSETLINENVITKTDVSTTEKIKNTLENKFDELKPGISLNDFTTSTIIETQENLERRLNIEEEVIFLGSQKAIAFTQPEDSFTELEDLPDDFYELSIDEVRKLYHDLQQNRIQLENTPLLTATKKEENEKQMLQQKQNLYKNVVVRIQFPDQIILQGVFTPGNKIQDVIDFVKLHLKDPEKPFHIFTIPLKETLDPNMTLQQAKFVPCIHMHFKWLEVDGRDNYLKEEIYSKKTTSDAARILASKYRAPSRRKIEDEKKIKSNNLAVAGSSTSKDSRLPKWFKK